MRLRWLQLRAARAFVALGLLTILFTALAACTPAAASTPPLGRTPSVAEIGDLGYNSGGSSDSNQTSATGTADKEHPTTVQPSPTSGRSPISPTATASPAPNSLSPISPPLTLTPTLAAGNTSANCEEDVCTYPLPSILKRPISRPGRDTWDVSYRFGSIQQGQRDPHHGVEFLNSQGTPVLAAADGVVAVAGNDLRTLYAPYTNFYGNLVVLQHTLPSTLTTPVVGLNEPLYTLYAHLSKITVQAGEQVKAGQKIGEVGMTGIATGSHLHFEVRLGKNQYFNSRNPELWLLPHRQANGQLNGALAGRFLDAQGFQLKVENIVLQHLPAPDQPPDGQTYLDTYEERALMGQSPWQESFAIGDLQPGWYRLAYVKHGYQQQVIQVLPGQLTLITIHIE